MSDRASTMRENVENATAKTSEAVHQAASTVVDKASGLASSAGKKADDATAALGEKVKSMAGTLREKGPREGRLGEASGAVADTLENAGSYLQERGLSGMAEELTELIRRNPIPAVLIGVGVGFLLAKALRR